MQRGSAGLRSVCGPDAEASRCFEGSRGLIGVRRSIPLPVSTVAVLSHHHSHHHHHHQRADEEKKQLPRLTPNATTARRRTAGQYDAPGHEISFHGQAFQLWTALIVHPLRSAQQSTRSRPRSLGPVELAPLASEPSLSGDPGGEKSPDSVDQDAKRSFTRAGADRPGDRWCNSRDARSRHERCSARPRISPRRRGDTWPFIGDASKRLGTRPLRRVRSQPAPSPRFRLHDGAPRRRSRSPGSRHRPQQVLAGSPTPGRAVLRNGLGRPTATTASP